MTSQELRREFLNFFIRKGHKIIPSASLIPKETDPTVLFTTAGMHPLVPYLLGEKHPFGKKLVNIQKCVRTRDIDKAGDATHLTFFEMLGYWSLNDYWKEESIKNSFNFFTEILKLDKNRISVTVFEGNKDIHRDTKTAQIWETIIKFPKKRIYYLPTEDNFWGPTGQIGPCGPCTEIFYDMNLPICGKNCKPGCHCSKYVEIGNNVFMEYEKTDKNKFVKLKQKNVDVGLGLERIAMIMQNATTVYETDLFLPIIREIRKYTGSTQANLKSERIIADHIKGAVFLISEGILPSNVERGYVLRRILRRAIRYGKLLNLPKNFLNSLVQKVIEIYQNVYPEIKIKQTDILTVIQNENEKFEKTLEAGLKELKSQIADCKFKKIKNLTGKVVFDLYQSYGFPLELTKEIAKEQSLEIDEQGFNEEFKKHQKLSRTASSGMFKSGLADASERTVKYHTATHLLHQALRQVLGNQVIQKGSNITAERLRFDFSYPQKMTEEQIKKVENIVNEKIKENLLVICREMNLENAKKSGALGLFEEKYGEKVKVYFIGDPSDSSRPVFSKEICAGPHINRASELGHFKIIKEESSSAGVRRIKATLD